MEKIKKYFDKYVNQFNTNSKEIIDKYNHSYRVMDYSISIAKSLNMNNEDINIVAIAALFHDIARFLQWTKYHTWQTKKSFDHGNKGYDILKDELLDKIIKDKEAQRIILLAVKNHNKYKIENGLTKKELLITNIIRDADKLDIIETQGNSASKNDVKEILIKKLKKHELINDLLVENDLDYIFRVCALIFDLNYSYSYKYLLDKRIIENKISLIEKYSKKELSDLKNDLKKYIKERIYVR